MRLGDFVGGVACANYGSNGRANLDVWEMADFDEWAFSEQGARAGPGEIDFREWVLGWLPSIGALPLKREIRAKIGYMARERCRSISTPVNSSGTDAGKSEKTDDVAQKAGNPHRAREVNFDKPTTYVRPMARST